MREETQFKLTDPDLFKSQAVIWADRFPAACILDNNQYRNNRYHTYDAVIAIDAVDFITSRTGSAFETLKAHRQSNKNWLFGFLSYDLKNEVEDLASEHADHIGFPDLYFFSPRYLLLIKEDTVIINRNYPEAFEIHEAIASTALPTTTWESPIALQPRIHKAAYIEKVEAIRQHIIEGDLYEMNLCQELFAANARINPAAVFLQLNQRSKAPHACYFKLNDRYLLCSSPERFLKKNGDELVSQPIKGTIRRGIDEAEDQLLQQQLQLDIKERAENVMIVDLVRNDLNRSCTTGSTKVEELFGIYPFQQVNQMISTVTGQLRPDVDPVDAIRNAFPMGSMTGAPKVMAMKLIEQYEKSRRGLYSGAVGYFTPEDDFDFNVVIRSILYNASNQYLSVSVGGAITYHSDPEKEYEECLLKAKAMVDSLKG